MENKEKLHLMIDLIKKIISWGAGIFLMIFGAITGVVSYKIGMPWPQWLALSAPIMFLGFLVFVVESIKEIILKKMENKEKK